MGIEGLPRRKMWRTARETRAQRGRPAVSFGCGVRRPSHSESGDPRTARETRAQRGRPAVSFGCGVRRPAHSESETRAQRVSLGAGSETRAQPVRSARTSTDAEKDQAHGQQREATRFGQRCIFGGRLRQKEGPDGIGTTQQRDHQRPARCAVGSRRHHRLTEHRELE